jgi:hypothetical protein
MGPGVPVATIAVETWPWSTTGTLCPTWLTSAIIFMAAVADIPKAAIIMPFDFYEYVFMTFGPERDVSKADGPAFLSSALPTHCQRDLKVPKHEIFDGVFFA